MSQVEYVGTDTINHLWGILKEIGAKNLLLVAERKAFELCGAKEALESVLESYNTREFTGISEPPDYASLIDGIKVYRESKPDVVIAVGGGSVIDTAKLVNYFSVQEHPPINYIMENRMVVPVSTPLIAIPTTSGTGSESTRFAVLYIDGKKYSIDDKAILPNFCIVDPSFSFSMPKRVAASSGMDALCQAIESYWSVNSSEESKNYAREALTLAVKNIECAVNTKERACIEAMSLAAHLAGKAINISRTTAPHALSYAMTSLFGVPHGEAVSLTVGEVLVANSLVGDCDASDPRGLAYVRETILEIVNLLGCSSPEQARDKLKEISAVVGLRTRLSQCGITNEDITVLSNSVNLQRLGNNPRKLSKEVIEGTLLKVL